MPSFADGAGRARALPVAPGAIDSRAQTRYYVGLAMARANYLVGRTIDQLLTWTEAVSPELAFRFKRHFYRPDMKFSLQLLQRSGLRPDTVVDVGAYVGDWTRECRAVFPEARVLMVEPGAARIAKLRALAARDPHVAVEQALLSSSEQQVEFEEGASNSSIVKHAGANTLSMRTTTLDALLAGTPFARPRLLKIDVQGHDLDVLIGGQRTLESVEALIVELSLIRLHATAPDLRTAIDWLDDHGFKLFDLAGLIRRPVDDALWQCDAVFVAHDSRLGRVDAGW